ncbi:MAG: IS110 family transposase [Bacteroidota bacterium]|jgi:Transposase and inactivated derivatives|nr:IS110 family transposase [Bacteroidota bacterium]
MEKECHYIGIDISKETFDVSFYDGVTHRHHQYANTATGFASFGADLSAASRCVMEATGVYHLHLAMYLYERGIWVSVVNPLVIRRFMQMQLRRAKTDKADAQQIALYGSTHHPAPWQPEPEAVTQMGQLYSLIEGITTYTTSLRNRREAFSRQPHGDRQLLKKLDREIVRQQKMNAEYLQQLIDLAQSTYGKAFEAVVSIPGIGKKTASLLVMVTNGFTAFDSSKQLIAYLGLSPRHYQSGSSVHGQAHICKMGMQRVRSALYICTWSAVRHNHACRELYARLLSRGKPAKLALVAVANKLVKQAFAIATNHTSYDPNFQRT